MTKNDAGLTEIKGNKNVHAIILIFSFFIAGSYRFIRAKVYYVGERKTLALFFGKFQLELAI